MRARRTVGSNFEYLRKTSERMIDKHTRCNEHHQLRDGESWKYLPLTVYRENSKT